MGICRNVPCFSPVISNGKESLGREDPGVPGNAARRPKRLKLRFANCLDVEFPLSLMGDR